MLYRSGGTEVPRVLSYHVQQMLRLGSPRPTKLISTDHRVHLPLCASVADVLWNPIINRGWCGYGCPGDVSHRKPIRHGPLWALESCQSSST